MSQRGLLRSAALTVLATACVDAPRTIVEPPADPSTGAVILGAVRTTAGAAVPGATGEINIFRLDGRGGAAYVGGRTMATDGMGEFAETVVLAYAGTFEASVHVLIVPPTGLALRPDSVTGTVPFTTGVTDTLRVTITLGGM